MTCAKLKQLAKGMTRHATHERFQWIRVLSSIQLSLDDRVVVAGFTWCGVVTFRNCFVNLNTKDLTMYKSTTVSETEYQPKTKELQLKSGVNMNTKQQTTQLEIETTILEPTN